MYELRIVKEGLLVMAECKTCGKFLHEEATICPSCRDPDPIARDKLKLSHYLLVSSLLSFVVFTVVFGLNVGIVMSVFVVIILTLMWPFVK
jgi:uncharacterized OB-fold protein